MEAASTVVRQGRFYHVPTAPSADVLYCPGGRTLASSRMVLVPCHPDLPGVDHLRAARDQWPDLRGMALQKFHVHHAVQEEIVVPAAHGWVLLIVPVARDFGSYAICLLSILTHGVPMEESTRNDLLRLRFCSNSSTFRECVPTLPFLVNATLELLFL